MHTSDIVIKGAREHNLKNISVTIPRSSLTVITGLSGSGKSSLAIDTLYSEGQRRYVESLSAYARQFLGLMEKPDVDSIEGLSPAICIEQRTISHNPRSTVGTITEIHDYLRLLYARVGDPFCYNCRRPISRQTVQEISDKVMAFPEKEKFQILSPVVSGRKGEYRELFKKLQKDGYIRIRVDNEIRSLDEEITLDKNKKHTIEVVVDRLTNHKGIRNRLTESLETALKLSANHMVIIDRIGSNEVMFSELLTCPHCDISYDELSPRMFSFNSPFGACEKCSGLGYLMEIDKDLVVPDPSRTLIGGALEPWSATTNIGSWSRQILESVCSHFDIPMNRPFKDLPARFKKIILYGAGKERILMRWQSRSREGYGQFKREFEGIIPNLVRRYKESSSEEIRRWIEGYMTRTPCPHCNGRRLRKESLAVRVNGKNIGELSDLAIENLKAFFSSDLKLSKSRMQIGRQILAEINQRLDFLINVGLSYLSLSRMASTLSGGETQRIRLATQIGSRLTGVIYILDEPSIGLHPRDNKRLLNTLISLRDLGNTVVVIEHDKETILAADYLIDIGPRAGTQGGEVVAQGTPKSIARNNSSVTGAYLSGKKTVPLPRSRRKGSGKSITLTGASGHNLKNINAVFPLGKLICVTGVSGSGKSTLIDQTLYPALARELYRSKLTPLPYKKIKGLSLIDKVIDIDQSPIGRTPRSNPATYTKLFDPIRNLFAMLPESKIRGYAPGRFSFNVKGGRCEACQGDGLIKIEMHFLPDVYVECETCRGKRYNRETLEITFKGKNISDVLEMTVDEALVFFDKIPGIKTKLSILSRVGLGYIHLGQQATTLSGGEAQRIKLAAELSKRATGKTMYILDEPTTGLHFEDIVMLMNVIQELVDKGNTIIVIEHNLDVIKCADHIIDIGPEGGDRGGRIIAAGTPEELTNRPESETGKYLKEYL
ncbi:MAG: excinuclease ABC subunit UvrA [Chitinivibrionales bacterium]|nr:excinuclease ABC subunit UvrA [Chitinivibrionales bacterium]